MTQLRVCNILNVFGNKQHRNGSLFLRCVVTGMSVCYVNNRFPPSVCLSPTPFLYLLAKLMAESLSQHIAISRSICGAQIVQNIPKIQSLSFKSAVCLSFFLFIFLLSSPPPCPSLHLLPLYRNYVNQLIK